MAQDRKAPAFQEYAASMIANKSFRSMTLAERGLLITMRYECWENINVPSPIHALAKYLGFDIACIQIALTDNVKCFFIEKDNLFTCPELDDYRQHLEERKTKQSEGGKRGSAMTNRKSNRAKKITSPSDSSNSQVTCQGGVESLVKFRTEKQSQDQSLESNINHVWINEYDTSERNEYAHIKG